MWKNIAAVLVIISAVVFVISAAEKYAVLLTGDYAAEGIPADFLWQSTNSDYPDKIVNPMPEFWYDTYLMWEMLIKKGYKDENIYVLFADGTDFNKTALGYYVDKRYTPQWINFPVDSITDYSATRANLELVVDTLYNKMHDDDFLFVWTFDHGGYSVGSSLTGWHSTIILMPDDVNFVGYDEMTDDDFALLFNPIKANKKVYWMQQCFGGGFWDDLTNNTEIEQNYDNVYFHSAVEMTKASVADDYTKSKEYLEHLEKELIGDVTYTHGEFNYHMYSVSMGYSPKPIYTNNYNGELFWNADLNNDGMISMSETSEWEIAHESLDQWENPPPPPEVDANKFDYSYDQVPLVSDFGLIGPNTTLEYPTIILNSYPEYMSFIKGIMGISGTLTINRADLILPRGSNTTLLKNSKADIYTGFNFINQTGSTLKLLDGSEINSAYGGKLFFYAGSNLLVNGSTRIVGNVEFDDGVSIEILDNSSLILQLSQTNILAGTIIKIGAGSSLFVGNGTTLTIEDGVVVELSEDAEIRIMDGGKLITNNNTSENVTFKSIAGMWYSIVGEVGSMIEIAGTEINGAEFGVCGAPSVCSITNSSFVGCENGISLVNCGDYTISDNAFSGKGTDDDGRAIGTGITLTSCSKPVIGNTIRNFAEGIKLISSSVILAKNRIVNNINCGLYITGHGSKPILVNTVSKDLTPSLNNEIINNCLNNPLYNGAQIYMKYSAGAYMSGGYNNVFSGAIGSLPTVPCIKGIINISPEPVISKVTIASERNYWGYNNINAGNQYLFFDLPSSIPEERELVETGYFIDYDPYALNPYIREQSSSVDLSSNEPRSSESILLFNAMKLEQLDNNTASIKIYEQIIKKYPETSEYFVAMTRLPELYIKEEITLDPLLAVFDEAIATETLLKSKFFKGLRVSTYIKAKNYDRAILYAEEMKSEAENEEEALLSEIDIAVANLMKEAEVSGKSANKDTSDTLKKLISKLYGSEAKTEPSVITEDMMIPTENKLSQNYPNPFNPVTQITFLLAKTADAKLSVFNISGQMVAELANGVMNAGSHSVEFDGSRLNSGVYYYMLEADGKSVSKKSLLIK